MHDMKIPVSNDGNIAWSLAFSILCCRKKVMVGATSKIHFNSET
jgi:hypothetical protein